MPPPWATTVPRSSTSSTKARKTLEGEGSGEQGRPRLGQAARRVPPRPQGARARSRACSLRSYVTASRLLWWETSGSAEAAHLESSSLQELVSTGLSVFTMHVMADTTPAASSFFTRARTKLGLSWGRRQLSRGPQLTREGKGALAAQTDAHANGQKPA